MRCGPNGFKDSLVQQSVERAQREETAAGERGEAALVPGLEKKRMHGAGGGEARAKPAAESVVRGAARGGPIGLAARIGEERIEGGLGALKRERHAVAGEGRDEAVRVAEGNGVGRRRSLRSGKTERGDGAERSGIGFDGGETRGERGQTGGFEVGEEQGEVRAGEPALAEEAAEVDLAAFDGGETDVGLVAEVEFEIAGERETARVDFQADPSRVAPTATVGEDAAGLRGEIGRAGVGAEFAAGGDEGGGEAGVEGVAAEAEGGRGEALKADRSFAVKPRDLVMVKRVGEKRREAEAREGGGGEAGDEFAADAVAWIAAGLEENDGDVFPAEGETEREPREAAANNLNGPGGVHARRVATMR